MSLEKFDVVAIGATRAAETLVVEAQRRRATVAWIRCFEESRTDEVLWQNVVNRTKSCRFYHFANELSDALRSELRHAIWSETPRSNSTSWKSVDDNRVEADSGVRILDGRPRFQTPKSLILDCGTRIESDAFVIATGASPRRPMRFDLDDRIVCDYRSMLRSASPPQSVAIVGADWLGCEWSSVCATAGAHVTLIDRRSRLLRALDSDFRITLQGRLHRMGVDIVLDEEIVGIHRGRYGECRVRLSSGREELVERSLILAGQVGNSAGLGLKEIGVQMDALGHISTDDRFRSSVPTVFAIGRVADPLGIAPSSSLQAQLALDAALGEMGEAPTLVAPWVLQSAIEIASCGLTAEACSMLAIDVVVGKASSRESDPGAARVAKVVVDGASGRLLGAQISGVGAAEAICQACAHLNRESMIEDCTSASSVELTAMEMYQQAANSALHQWRGSSRSTVSDSNRL